MITTHFVIDICVGNTTLFLQYKNNVMMIIQVFISVYVSVYAISKIRVRMMPARLI